MIDKNSPATKLLWVDLEMTGLNTQTDVILEVAAEVTDLDFRTLGSYAAVIKQSEEKLLAMDEWCTEQHTKSGLVERVRTGGLDETVVVQQLTDFISEHFGGEPAILSGNSIHNDRQFIKVWWPQIDQLLHYRMLDVSSFKILMNAKYDTTFEKAGAHRAYDDIRASIAELEFYLKKLQK